MTDDVATSCPLGLSAETLSTYRASGLDSTQATRVAAHVAGCVACQARLAEYEAMGAALAAQRVPAPGDRIWRAVRASMAEHTRRRVPVPPMPSRQLLSGLCAATAIVLLVAGFATLFQRTPVRHPVIAQPITTPQGPVKSVPTPTASPTSVPSPYALQWQPVHTPPGFNPRIQSTNIFAPSPADGRTAYACDEPLNATTSPHPAVWVTHDLGTHWTQITDFPATPTGWCTLIVDQYDPNVVLLGLSSGSPMQGPPGADHYFASLDGGVTWQAVPGLQGPNVIEMATAGGITYVVALSSSPTADGVLLASSDGLRTWQSAAPRDSEVAQDAQELWVDPASGALLAETVPADQVTNLFTSGDGGQHWTRLSAAGMPTTGYFYVRASSGQPWHICGAWSADATSGAPSQLTCSDDGGKTWTTRMIWNGDGPNVAHPGRTFILTANGAVLATVVVPEASGPEVYQLWRLAPGASAWQSLGPVAQLTLAYSVQPSPGRLWALPFPMMGSTDPQARLFTVAYGG